MSRILHAMRPMRWALLATVLAGLLLPGTVSAGESASEIEGVWSFSHGAVDVVPVAGGKFEGIVTVQTQFANCPHKVEEHMWTDITQQSDGSYWGLHQWFHADCSPNAQLGPTAWRVIHEANGSRYLRVCFSDPGGKQPTISPDGAPREPSEYAAHDVSYDCVNSELLAQLPASPGTTTGSGPTAKGEVEAIALRKANQCVRPELFKINFKQPKYDPFKKVTVTFQGHRVRFSRKGQNIVVTLNLRHLKKNTFTVKVTATTVLGHRLTNKRTYHLCAPKKPKHSGKKHHKKKG